jgi:hypothetical protein
MPNQRLIHDHAYAMATALLELMVDCLREEERLEAFNELYCLCKSGLESYELHRTRMIERLNPTRN